MDEKIFTKPSAAPAGATPAPSAAQNITVEDRVAMNIRRRIAQDAAAPSSPGLATATPAASAAPSEGTPPATTGAEPDSTAGAESAPAPAPVTVPQSQPQTPAEALADAAQPAETAGSESPTAEPEEPGDLNGKPPEWMQAILDGDNAAVPSGIKSLLKRVGNLTAQLRAAEAALAAGREPGEAPAPEADESKAPAQGQPQQPAAAPAVSEYAQLRKAVDDEWKVIAWCEANRNGGYVGEQEFTGEQVAEQLVQSQRKLNELDKRQVHLEAQHRNRWEASFNASKAEASKRYPWMLDPKSATAEAREAKAYLNANEHLLADPQWPLVVGRYVTGLMAERRAANGNGKNGPVAAPMARPRANGAPAPAPGAPGSAAPRVDPRTAEMAELQQEYEKTGSVKVLTKLRQLQAKSPRTVGA